MSESTPKLHPTAYRNCYGETHEDRRDRLKDYALWKDWYTYRDSLKKAGYPPEIAYKLAAWRYRPEYMADDPYPEELLEAGAGSAGAEAPGEPDDPRPKADKKAPGNSSPPVREQAAREPQIPPHLASALMPLEEAELKTPSLMRDVTWVAERLGVKGVTSRSAPSSLAWGIYKWANANQMNQTQFWTRVMPSKSALEASARFEDDGSSIEQLIDRFQGHHAYVERKFDN